MYIYIYLYIIIIIIIIIIITAIGLSHGGSSPTLVQTKINTQNNKTTITTNTKHKKTQNNKITIKQ